MIANLILAKKPFARKIRQIKTCKGLELLEKRLLNFSVKLNVA